MLSSNKHRTPMRHQKNSPMADNVAENQLSITKLDIVNAPSYCSIINVSKPYYI